MTRDSSPDAAPANIEFRAPDLMPEPDGEHPETQYLELMARILGPEGEEQQDRTGTGTRSVWGAQMRFDLRAGFPLLTTKFIPFRVVVHELLWMIGGQTNVRPLQERGVTIWDEWARPDGSLGPVYGAQWRRHAGVRRAQVEADGRAPVIYTDQLAWAIEQIRTNPGSRRILVESWNPSELCDMALTPCHRSFQFRVSGDEQEYLDLAFQMRSNDIFLGNPLNIAAYALLLMMVAQVTDKVPRYLVYQGTDCHLYLDHLPQAALQLTRTPRALPRVTLDPTVRHIDDFRGDDEEKGPKGSGWIRVGHFLLRGYHPHPHIKANVSV